MFAAGLRRASTCSTCAWTFERGEGHWIGGAEINMIATYWVGCLTFLAIHVVFGMSMTSLVAAALFTIAVSLVLYRVSRSLFVALDFLADPVPDDEQDDDRRSGDGGAGDPIPLFPAPRATSPRGDVAAR